MTDVWISQKKHYCQVCNCWIAGHPRNILTHEQTEGHRVNQEKQIQRIYANQKQLKFKELEVKKELERVDKVVMEQIGDPFGKKRKTVLKPKMASDEDTEKKVAGPQLPVISTTYRGPGVYSAAPKKYQLLPPKNPPPPLPPPTTCWMTSIDPQTNRPIYFNTITGEVRHDDPSHNTDLLRQMNISGPDTSIDVEWLKKQQKFIFEAMPKARAAVKSAFQPASLEKPNHENDAKTGNLINKDIQELARNIQKTITPKQEKVFYKKMSQPLKSSIRFDTSFVKQASPDIGSHLKDSAEKEHASNNIYSEPEKLPFPEDSGEIALRNLIKPEPTKDSSVPKEEPTSSTDPAINKFIHPIADVIYSENVVLGEWEEVTQPSNYFGAPADDSDSEKSEDSLDINGPEEVSEMPYDQEISSRLFVQLKEDSEKVDYLNSEDLQRNISSQVKENLKQNNSKPCVTFKKRMPKNRQTPKH